MKKRRMTNMKALWMAGFLIAAISVMFTMTGCSKDTTESITNPISATFKPTGTIQGVVVDAVTREPIVGARVSVGVGEATTNDMGLYVIKNVPATTDALNGSVNGQYDVAIDLRNATKPINMKTATEKYPEFSYRTVEVEYTSLNDTECQDTFTGEGGAETCSNSSNHDTKVDGLIANLQIEIGRLACNIKGTVYGCYGADYATPESAQVRLDSGDNSDNTGSGHFDNIISTVDAGSDGTFEFTNIECGGRDFQVVAADSLDNPTKHDVLETTGPDGNNETLVLHLDQCDYGYGTGCTYTQSDDPSKDRALHLCPNDDLGPRIVEVTPESGSDLAQSATQSVVLTFHEPVAQNSFTDTSVSGQGNLYDWIEVQYDGSKAGNVSYSLAWLPAGCTDACTQLQVTFPTGTSSLYRVTLKDVNILTDAAGNPAMPGVCPVDSPTGGPWGNTEGDDTDVYGDDDCVVAFSTTGGNTPAQVTDLVLKNDASLDEANAQVGQYDWSIVSGAKTYAMYCQKVQVWGSATQEGPFVKDDIDTADDGIVTSGSSAQVDFDILADGLDDGVAFVENSEIELRYNCQVAGVNADGVEGPLSDIAANAADDAVGPELVEDTTGALTCDGGNTGAESGNMPTAIGTICDLAVADGGDGLSTTIDQIVLGFNEVMNETAAETVGNYNVVNGTTTLSAISNSAYDVTNNMVLLTLTTAVNPTALARSTITGGTNGVVDSEGVLAGDDVLVRSTCVTEGATSVTAVGDDVDSTPGAGSGVIDVGPDGICNTTKAVSDGTQNLTVGNGLASSACVGPGTNAVLNTTVAGDDVAAGTRINSGPNGICQTTASGDDTQDVAVGQGLPSTTITAGPNMVLNTSVTGTDDVITHQPGVKVEAGVTDVGVNAIRTTADQFNTDGTVQ